MITTVAAEQGERSRMQDAHAINFSDEADVGVFGVFDGHDDLGHEVADQLADEVQGLDLTPLAKDDMETTLLQVQGVLARVHDRWSSRPDVNEPLPGGSTAIVAIVSKLAITGIYVGDGIAKFYPDSGSSEDLTVPHNSDNPEEIERITAMGYGNKIQPVADHPSISRFGGLLVSRAIGTRHKPYVSSTPETRTINRRSGLMVLATDGVYGHHPVWGPGMFDDIVESVRERDPYGSEAQARRMVSNGSLANGDNATVLLVGLPPSER